MLHASDVESMHLGQLADPETLGIEGDTDVLQDLAEAAGETSDERLGRDGDSDAEEDLIEAAE